MSNLDNLTAGKTAGAVIGVVIAVVIAFVLFLSLGGFLLMLGYGAVAGIFGWPTASFAQSIGGYFFLSTVGGLLRGNKASAK